MTCPSASKIAVSSACFLGTISSRADRCLFGLRNAKNRDFEYGAERRSIEPGEFCGQFYKIFLNGNCYKKKPRPVCSRAKYKLIQL